VFAPTPRSGHFLSWLDEGDAMIQRMMGRVGWGVLATAVAACSSNSGDGGGGGSGGTTLGGPNPTSCTADTCPTKGTPVVFRLDDLQNGWCTAQQTAIVDAFVENGYPISVGIIGEMFDPNGPSSWDKTLTDYMNSDKIQAAIKSGLVQVVSHSYAHVESSSGLPGMSGMTAEAVAQDLQQCADVIHGTGMIGDQQPATFTVPLNAYGEALETGAKNAGIRAFTAQCSVDEDGKIDFCEGPGANTIMAPSPMKDPEGIYQLAAGAVIEEQGFLFAHYTDPADFDAALGWAKRQADRQGFVVYMLHPQEFTTAPQCNPPGPSGVDTAKIAVMLEVLGALDDWGVKLTTFQGLLQDIDPSAPAVDYTPYAGGASGAGGSGGSGGSGATGGSGGSGGSGTTSYCCVDTDTEPAVCETGDCTKDGIASSNIGDWGNKDADNCAALHGLWCDP
jgi:hypothetical protein